MAYANAENKRAIAREEHKLKPALAVRFNDLQMQKIRKTREAYGFKSLADAVRYLVNKSWPEIQ